MEQFFSSVTYFIDIWGYWAIFLGMALESANIPIPSELIFGFAGYLVYLGRLEFWPATIYGVLGGLAGSIVSYGIGYYGGRPFVFRYGKYFFVTPKRLDQAQRWFDRYGLAAVFFARLMPVVRTFISLPAGFAQVPFVKFVIYTVVGSFPWTVALIYIGKMLGYNWEIMNRYGHQASVITAIALVAIAAFWYFKKKSAE
ncbi:MAG: DedA family protein [Sporomusaceae bacterium]|nr:DedA family protein [Sporomusaceae bacterium]